MTPLKKSKHWTLMPIKSISSQLDFDSDFYSELDKLRASYHNKHQGVIQQKLPQNIPYRQTFTTMTKFI